MFLLGSARPITADSLRDFSPAGGRAVPGARFVKITLSDLPRPGCLMGEMPARSDVQLLRDYAEDGQEAAFRELVARHADFVYSAALRQVNSPDLAADVAQGVFTDLARRAPSLLQKSPGLGSLAGWLHRGTRYAALNLLRDTHRRLRRERQAMEQLLINADPAADWERIRPLLDEALDSLGDDDREALLLRYFKNQDFLAVGLALGVSDDTAQKRVSRAVERLREFFAKRGVTVGVGGLAVVISANAVQAAPAGLAATISTAATLAGTTLATTTTATLIKAVAMTALQKTLITTALAVVAGAGIYEAHQNGQLRERNRTLQRQQVSWADQLHELQRLHADATNRLAVMVAENERLKSGQNAAELLELRSKVTSLQSAATDPSDVAAKDLVARVHKLKQLLEQTPNAKIPELHLLNEQDWLTASKDCDLDSENGVRRALSWLREIAVQKFANLAEGALAKFAKAQDKAFPDDPSRLQQYFDPPVDTAILQRWEVLPAGARLYGIGNTGPFLTQKAPADELLDRRYAVGQWGFSCADFLGSIIEDDMKPVYAAYNAANNDVVPQDLAALLPYATTPEQKSAVQKLLQQFALQKSAAGK
jgi:RNA polymerase sigma factor (sigma-70 family)